MKIGIIGRPDLSIEHIRKDIAAAGFEFSETEPDIVVSYGGDGTLLATERLFPGVPKLPIKQSPTCKKCHDCDLAHALDLIKREEYEIMEMLKLECSVNDEEKRICLNDFVIRNDLPTHALRFSVEVNGEKYENLIGDGIVVSTPFGSTAYFSSVARKSFDKGIGLAFNNLTVPIEHLILDEDAVLKIKIERRTGLLVADNNPEFVKLRDGDIVVIKKSLEPARIIKLKK